MMMDKRYALFRWLLAIFLMVGIVPLVSADTGGTTELVSQILDPDLPPDAEIEYGQSKSSMAALDRSGRWVVFSSEESAVTLAGAGADANDSAVPTYRWDVFLRDRQSPAATYLLSRYRTGSEDAFSIWGAISPNGQFAVFQSNALDLDFEDPCGQPDPSLTGGHFQMYLADLRTVGDIKLYLITRRMSITPPCEWEEGDADSGKQSNLLLSSYFPAALYTLGNTVEVIFQSRATNLLYEVDGVGQDLFSYRADVSDLALGTLTQITRPDEPLNEIFKNGYFRAPSITADGSRIALVLGTDSSETSGQIYMLDRDSDNDGEFGDFDTPPAYMLVSRNWETNEPGNEVSGMPSLSADGITLAYASKATNLLVKPDIKPDTNAGYDIFVFNFRSQVNSLISLASSGLQAAGGVSYSPVVSRNGQLITFQSNADDISASDTDGFPDVYLYRQGILPVTANNIALLSVNNGDINSNGNGAPMLPVLAGDGLVAAFTDYSTNMPDAASAAPTVGNVYARAITHDPAWNTDPKPIISESPSNWDFGLADITGSAKKTFRITNIGEADLHIDKIEVVAVGNYSFDYQPLGGSNDCIELNYPNGLLDPAVQFTLTPMQSCYIDMQFFVEFGDTGVHIGSIQITSNDPESGTLNIGLVGGAQSHIFLPLILR